jgi:hypothetical protein
MLTAGRYFNVVQDIDETPTEALDVLKSFGDIFSGISNGAKAVALLNYQKRMNAQGVVVEQGVDYMEAAMQALGFGTTSMKELYTLQQKWYKDVEQRKEDALKMYNRQKAVYYAKLGLPDTDPRMLTKINSLAMEIIKQDPEVADIILARMRKDFAGKDKALLLQIVKSIGVVDKDDIKRMPGISEEERKMINDFADSFSNAKKTLQAEQEKASK